MKGILLVCDSFPPDFAPRMGCLARYLERMGWRVSVLATCLWEDSGGIYDVPGLEVPVIRVAAAGLMGKEFGVFRRWVARAICRTGEYDALVRRMVETGEKMLDERPVDVILASTSYDPFIFEVANRLAQQSGVPWVADNRDIFEQYPQGGGVRGWMRWLWTAALIRRRNTLLRRAAACIAVTELHHRILAGIHSNAHLVYNGYDPETFRRAEVVESSRFEVVYGGQIYRDPRFQDPSLLFDGVCRLRDAGEIHPDEFCMTFYLVPHSREHIGKFVRDAGLESLVRIESHLPMAEYAEKLGKASVALLVASNGSQGVMTTKFFEYLGTGRPVLLVRSDEDCLERAVNESGCGCAARSVEDVCAFLRAKFAEWKATGQVRSTTDAGYAARFSREGQADQIAAILEAAERGARSGKGVRP